MSGRTLCSFTLFCIVLLSCLLTPFTGVSAQAGGFDLFAGETLFAEGWRANESYIYVNRRGVDDQSLITEVTYGLLPGFNLSALVPWIHRRVDSRYPEGVDRDFTLNGLGDLGLLAKYRAHHHQWEGGGALAWSVIGGLSVPTGDDNARRDGREVPSGLQLGTGTWDPLAATAVTLEIGRWRFDGNLFYVHGFHGDLDGGTWSAKAEAGYRFLLRPYPGPSANAKLGLRWRNEGRGDRAKRLFLRTGISAHPRADLDLGLFVEVPMWQSLDDEARRTDLRAQFVIGLRF